MQGMSSGDRRGVAAIRRAGLLKPGLPTSGLLSLGLLCAGLSLPGASGCFNSDADGRIAAKATLSGPQQVVQRIEPAPASAALSSGKSAPGAAASGAAASSQREAAKSEPPANAEPITSKHLEAELNRLEAELR